MFPLALALGQGLSRGPLRLARSSDRARVWHHNVGRLPYGWTRAGGYQVGQERCPTTAEQGPRGVGAAAACSLFTLCGFHFAPRLAELTPLSRFPNRYQHVYKTGPCCRICRARAHTPIDDSCPLLTRADTALRNEHVLIGWWPASVLAWDRRACPCFQMSIVTIVCMHHARE